MKELQINISAKLNTKLNDSHASSKNDIERLRSVRLSFKDSENSYYDEFLIVDYIKI